MFRTIYRAPLWAGIAALTIVGCSQGGSGTCAEKAELGQCREKGEKLRKEVNKLKRTLAQALANPGMVKVDSKLLVIEGEKPGSTGGTPREGTLSQSEVISTVTKNKGALQACYNRLIKRDSSFHHRTLKLRIGFSVQTLGSPTRVTVAPKYDAKLAACISAAIRRWKFPRFKGTAVDVVTPFTLKPKG